MNVPATRQTAAGSLQMEQNPLQRALDNYLVMELQCEAAKTEAGNLRTVNAQLIAEVGLLREQLKDTEVDRRKWEVACSTLLGRLLAINDTIAGAVKQAVRDGLEAKMPVDEKKDEPGEAEGVAAAAAQCAGTAEFNKVAPEMPASPAPPQLALAAVPKNQFLR